MFVSALAILAVLSTVQPAARCLSDMLPSDGTRVAKPAGKGVELYSWEARDGRLQYAFLWGTNRLKTKAEIKSPACALTTTAEVMGIFSRFAAGEHVFWFWTAEECAECAYPSQETVDALVAHARVVGIKLELGARDFEVDVPEFVHEAECFQPGAPGHGG